MIHLFTSYYKDNSKNYETRQKELDFCLKKNMENYFLDKVHLLTETNDIPYKRNDSMIIYKNKRPTFFDFFKEINNIVTENDISIISNSDIYFDKTIKECKNIKENEVYAISKKELCRPDSQDAWAWKGKMKNLNFSDFYLGKIGCDNRIAWEFKNKGYIVKNPSLTIILYHVHESKARNYNIYNDRVPGPYHKVPPEKI